MATVRAEGDVEGARGIADRSVKVEAKKGMKDFIDAIIAKRRYFKERVDRKKLRKRPVRSLE